MCGDLHSQHRRRWIQQRRQTSQAKTPTRRKRDRNSDSKAKPKRTPKRKRKRKRNRCDDHISFPFGLCIFQLWNKSSTTANCKYKYILPPPIMCMFLLFPAPQCEIGPEVESDSLPNPLHGVDVGAWCHGVYGVHFGTWWQVRWVGQVSVSDSYYVGVEQLQERLDTVCRGGDYGQSIGEDIQ